jgi:hypothetical protein
LPIASSIFPKHRPSDCLPSANDVFVVGAHSAFRVRWEPNARSLSIDDASTTGYRTLYGQTGGLIANPPVIDPTAASPSATA